MKMNSQGFRDKERLYEKSKGTFRILILGDSMTEGLEVPLERTFPYILENKLNSKGSKKCEVINLSISGFGTAQEYLMLKHYGLKYNPDLVILVFSDQNDVSDNFFNSRKGQFVNKPFFVLNKGTLVKIPFELGVADHNESKNYVVMSVTENFQILKVFLAKIFPHTYYSLSDKINERPWLAQFLLGLGIKNAKLKSIYDHKAERYLPNSYERQNAWDVTKALILRVSKELKENGVGFLFVIVPEYGQSWVNTPDKKAIKTAQFDSDSEKPEPVLSEFLEENGIDYLHLSPKLQQYVNHIGNTFIFVNNNWHWNATGHVLVAGLINNKLKEHKLVPTEAKKLSVKRN
ncbi:MAG: hypothetical protein ACREOB_00435 [Thermodesulfobacteriota bacterium]